MRIPAAALGNTPSPYTEIVDSTRGQKDAASALGRAQLGEAAALSDAGQTMSSVGKDVYSFTKRIEEQEALTAVQAGRSRYHVEGAQTALDWENTIDGPTALSSPNALKERLQPIKQKIIDGAPSELAKERIRLDLDAREADLMVHGEKVARRKFTEHSLAVKEETNQNFLKGAYLSGQMNDVGSLQGNIDQGKAGLMALGTAGIVISPSEAELEAGKFEVAAVGAFLHGQLDNDRTAMKAVRDFEAGKYNDKLDFKTLTKMAHTVEVRKNQLIAEARRGQAEARQRAREDAYDTMEYLKDQVSSATATGKVTGDTAEAIAKVRRLGGTFARQADNLDAAITSGVAVHGALQENVFLPFDEQRTKLQALQPKEGEENFAIKAHAVDRGLSVIDSQEQAFRRDPAGSTIPRAAAIVARDGKNPAEDPIRVIRASLEIQKQLGLGDADTRIIPAADAKRIAADFATGDADSRLDILSKLDVYGAYKSKALAQLKIDPSAQHAAVILDTNNPQARNAARLMVDTSPDKIKLTADEDAAFTKDIVNRAEVPALLKKQGAWMGTGGVGRNEYAQELITNAARMSKVMGDPKKAAAILDMPYSVVDDSRLALALVPKDIPEKDALAGFSAIRNTIREEDMLEVRAGLIAKFGQAQGTRLFAEKVRDIKGSGVWIDDGGGYALYDPGTRRPVRLDGGRTFRISTEQLLRAAKNAQERRWDSITDEAGIQ